MLEDISLLRFAQPVTDDVGCTQLNRTITLCAYRLQSKAILAIGTGLQAGTFEQRRQSLLRGVLTFQPRLCRPLVICEPKEIRTPASRPN